ncbi:MAG TPA: hypothetical protein VF147_16165 [Vicinamibacterales bacterium]
MDALAGPVRSRLAAALEWVVAAAFLAATIAVASLLYHDLKIQPRHAAPSAVAESPLAASVPPWVPEQALSVPVLPLVGGKELRIGDTVSSVAERLGRAAESGRQEVDRGRNGERLTRFYEYSGSRFILVFEPLERNGDAKLAAIYVTDR